MNTQEIRTQVRQILDHAQEIYGVRFETPEIAFTLRGRAAGVSERYRLNFNSRWIEESDFNQVVIHEVAHHVQKAMYPYSKPHGQEWQRIIARLGGKVERCHSYDTSALPTRRIYRLYCPCGVEHMVGKKIFTNIFTGKKKYRCTTCNSLLTTAK